MFRSVFNSPFQRIFAGAFINDGSPPWIFGAGESGPPVIDPLVFDALTYDLSTFEMAPIRTGATPMLSPTGTTHNAKDADGVYQQYPVNTPVNSGARVTLAGGAGSLVAASYANDGVNALPNQPFNEYCPDAMNAIAYSNDLTQWMINGVTVTRDQIGLDGTLSATKITNVAGGDKFVRVDTPAAASSSSAPFWILKDSDESRFAAIHGAVINTMFHFNTKTGAITKEGAGDSFPPPLFSVEEDLIDGVTWWKLIIESGAASGGHFIRIFPSRSTVFGGAYDSLATGSIVVAQVGFHAERSIARIKHLGPIFTAAIPLSAAATPHTFDSANHSDTVGAYYLEVASSGPQEVLGGFLSITGGNFQLTDGTNTVTLPWTADAVHNVGVAYSDVDGLMSLSVNGVESADIPYNGALLQGALDWFRAGIYPAKMRNLKRFNADTYQEAKDLRDAEMIVYLSGDYFDELLIDDLGNFLIE
jgi:hypothetical protein